jgi:paraquat-inducible protein B
MSKRASPTLIGAFVLGAIVLAIIGIGALASNRYFTQRATFISYFDESVNGLDVGAPVKFKGVPIGRVTDIRLRVDLQNETFQVPVLYEIDLEPVTDTTGATIDLSNRDLLREQVDSGLRAQLQLESFLTGKLYVELTFMSDPGRADYAQVRQQYPEIPTELSPLAQLGEEAESLVANLQSFDVSTINENLVTLLVKANNKVDQLDVRQINTEIIETVTAARRLVESDEIRTALNDVPALSQKMEATLSDAQSLLSTLEGSVEPTTAEVKETGKELRETMNALQETMKETNDMMSTDSGIGYRMEESLAKLSDAAEAIRVLAVSLERNPGMFIRGKQGPEAEDN